MLWTEALAGDNLSLQIAHPVGTVGTSSFQASTHRRPSFPFSAIPRPLPVYRLDIRQFTNREVGYCPEDTKKRVKFGRLKRGNQNSFARWDTDLNSRCGGRMVPARIVRIWSRNWSSSKRTLWFPAHRSLWHAHWMQLIPLGFRMHYTNKLGICCFHDDLRCSFRTGPAS